MTLTLKRPSNSQIDRAGKLIRTAVPNTTGKTSSNDGGWSGAFGILSDWRALHATPLNAIAATLRRRANTITSEPLVAQRLKRFVSIREKLLDKPEMALARMQDIAGCRAVMSSIDDVYLLKARYEQHARKHPMRGPELIANSTKDYILEPKEDGYRGIHMVMKYRIATMDLTSHPPLRVEIQIRSRLQHAWAMAVETVSSATAQALKAGRGREDWKRFFRLMSSAIALKENMPMVPGTDEISIYRGIRELALDLRVIPLLENIRPAAETVRSDPRAKPSHPDDLYLLELNAEQNTVNYRMFPRQASDEALQAYAAAERVHVNSPNIHVVLVSVEDIDSLKVAYPSYFSDMNEFIGLIGEALDLGGDHMMIHAAEEAGLIEQTDANSL